MSKTISAAASDRSLPVLWMIIGDKLGDNAQIEVVADALGWPTVRKRLRFRAPFVTGKPKFRPSLYHIDPDASDPLVPPWPDVALTIGRRPSMAALWVKAQSADRCKVVIVGRPRRLLRRFDLVLAPPQYQMPARDSVVPLTLPLFRPDRGAIDAAGVQWRDRFSDLPRPLTAVLVGGPTGPFIFDAAVTSDFVSRIQQTTGETGTVYVTTSRRTPPDVAEALAVLLPAGSKLFRWSADRVDNPYQGLLALADRFIVTGDSVSMIVEVAQLGRPLSIFPLPQKSAGWQRLRRAVASVLQPPAMTGTVPGPLGWLGDRLYDLGFAASSREFDALYDALLQRGLATRLGQPFPEHQEVPPDDIPQVVARIRALVGQR